MVNLVTRHSFILFVFTSATVLNVFCSGYFSYVTDKEDPSERVAFVPLKNANTQRYVRDVQGNTQDFKHNQTKTSNSPPAKTKKLFESTTVDPHDDYSDVGLNHDSDDYTVVRDHHYYYNSSFSTSSDEWQRYWVNLEGNTSVHVLHDAALSTSNRKAVTVRLQFEFPFYGQMLRNVTVTTGGFLFTGDHAHSWLAATQYIAPLMANFDPSLKNTSAVKYFDNGTAFTVQWENVHLKDRIAAGSFTFQVTLLHTGYCITYCICLPQGIGYSCEEVRYFLKIPIEVTAIGDEGHPVKVGLSDAYVIDRTIYFMRRKTIYEYHRVDLKKREINNYTSIYFTALPTCVALKDCPSCVEANIGFQCAWCAGRCSDGIDRLRQDWLLQGCGQQDDAQQCPEAYNSESNTIEHHSQITEVTNRNETNQVAELDNNLSSSSLEEIG